MSNSPCPTDSPSDTVRVIQLDDWRRRMVVDHDVRRAIELAYELSQQIASLDLPSAFPAFSQSLQQYAAAETSPGDPLKAVQGTP
jgi:hypothetical protein